MSCLEPHPKAPAVTLELIPEEVREYTKNFSELTWFINTTNRYHHTGFIPLYFGLQNVALFLFHDPQLITTRRANKLFSLFKTGWDDKSSMKDIETFRVNVGNKLREGWGDNAAQLAEQYIALSLNQNITLVELLSASPVILDCYKVDGDVKKKYQVHSNLDLVRTAKLTNNQETFNEFLKLPLDTIRSFT